MSAGDIIHLKLDQCEVCVCGCIEWLQYHFNEANCSIAAANEILQRVSVRFHAGLQGYQLATRAGPVFHFHPGSGGMSPFEHLHRWESQTRVERAVKRLHPAAIRDKAFFAEGGCSFQLNLQPLISNLLQRSSSYLIVTNIILSSKKHRG